VSAEAPVVAGVPPSPVVAASDDVTVCTPKNTNEAAIGRIIKALSLLFMPFNPSLGFRLKKRHYVFGVSESIQPYPN
jgi:hypothetical protein